MILSKKVLDDFITNKKLKNYLIHISESILVSFKTQLITKKNCKII